MIRYLVVLALDQVEEYLEGEIDEDTLCAKLGLNNARMFNLLSCFTDNFSRLIKSIENFDENLIKGFDLMYDKDIKICEIELELDSQKSCDILIEGFKSNCENFENTEQNISFTFGLFKYIGHMTAIDSTVRSIGE